MLSDGLYDESEHVAMAANSGLTPATQPQIAKSDQYSAHFSPVVSTLNQALEELSYSALPDFFIATRNWRRSFGLAKGRGKVRRTGPMSMDACAI